MTVTMIDLSEDTFILFAAKHYDNPNCNGIVEFYDDLRLYKCIRKLLNRFDVNKDLNERLIINHIVTLNNLFGVANNIKMLLFKIDHNLWQYLRPFLIYLEMDTEELKDIDLNKDVVDKLRKL